MSYSDVPGCVSLSRDFRPAFGLDFWNSGITEGLDHRGWPLGGQKLVYVNYLFGDEGLVWVTCTYVLGGNRTKRYFRPGLAICALF